MSLNARFRFGRRAPELGAASVFASLLMLVLVVPTSAAHAVPQEPGSDGSDFILARDAGDHVGEEVRICGKVVQSTYMQSMEGRPTFLNFVNPWPEQVFSVHIPGDDLEGFPRRPDRMYRDEVVCVTGLVEMSDSGPRMTVTSPDLIEIVAGE